VDVVEGSGVVASIEGRPVGLITWVVETSGARAEIRAIAVEAASRRLGIGRALLAVAHASLRAAGVRWTWLTTTNDNVDAIHLYEGVGYHVTEVRHGAVDELRRTVKPSIALFGENGMPIRDELEFELRL
jgi:ribosomal protein S18 acetylase RimI-like enzyme